jgi:hypothetical protein
MVDPWRIESYETVEGSRPFEKWAEALAPRDRRALVAAIDELLVPLGPGICATPWGRHLGQGLFELRIARVAASGGRPSPAEPAQSHRMLLRVFCHACGDRVVVLLGGYDKLRQPKRREQDRQIRRARRRLADLQRRRPRHGG